MHAGEVVIHEIECHRRPWFSSFFEKPFVLEDAFGSDMDLQHARTRRATSPAKCLRCIPRCTGRRFFKLTQYRFWKLSWVLAAKVSYLHVTSINSLGASAAHYFISIPVETPQL